MITTHGHYSIAQLIDEVRYELDMRARVYPGQVFRNRMRRSEAEYHMDRMRALLSLLQRLQQAQLNRRADDEHLSQQGAADRQGEAG
jgi:hypothetical protein